MAFREAGGGNPDKLGLSESREISSPAIAHAGAQTAYELV
jgi:hypothetical protein